MKKLLVVASALVSLASYACPDLSGSYDCTEVGDYGSENYALDITQSGNVYNMSYDGAAGSDIVADGVARQFSTPEASGSMQVSCFGGSLVMNLNAQVTDQMTGVMTQVNQTSSFTKNASTLTMSNSTTVYGQTFSSTATCTQN